MSRPPSNNSPLFLISHSQHFSVIKLMLQFMQENGLEKSARMLQEESGVTFRPVRNVEALAKAVEEGRWDQALEMVSNSTEVSATKLYDLYEVMLVDLAAAGETEAARVLLRRSAISQALRDHQSRRYQKLESLMSRLASTDVQAAEGYFGYSLEERRLRVAQRLRSELTMLPQGRLMHLIDDAFKWQVGLRPELLPIDTKFDLFYGLVPREASDDRPCTQIYLRKEYASTSTVAGGIECASFLRLPLQQKVVLVVGRSDGGLEWLHPSTGHQLAPSMLLPDPVMCIDTASNGFVAVGLLGGTVHLVNHQRNNEQIPLSVHDEGVSALCFSPDNNILLSGGHDGVLAVTLVKTQRSLCKFKHHTAFITDCVFSPDGTLAYSVGADGLCCVWDLRTSSLKRSLHPFSSESLTHSPIQKIIPLEGEANELLLISRAGKFATISADGRQIEQLSSANPKAGDIVSALVSYTRSFLYILHENGHISVYDLRQRPPALIDEAVADSQIIGGASHPFHNQLITFDLKGTLAFWKP